MQLIPIVKHNWTEDYSYLREVTCKNHQTAVYLTKNPYNRSLHLVELPEGMTEECKCPFADLAVLVDDNGNDDPEKWNK
jgi:hypothetical protein